MKTIEINENILSIRLSGWDAFFSFKKSIDIPLSSIREFYKRPKNIKPPAWRDLGIYISGIIAAGNFSGKNRKEFWSSRLKNDCIIFELEDYPLTRIAIDHSDSGQLFGRLKNISTPAEPADAVNDEAVPRHD